MNNVHIPERLEKLIDCLPDLTIEQLKEIRTRCSYFIQQRTKPNQSNDDYILSGILTELEDRGLGATIPKSFKIKNNRSFAAYLTTSEQVKNHLELSIPNMTFTQKKALGIIAARCLAKHILSWNGDISLETMLKFVSRIPASLNYYFPGYVECGLLHLIFEVE